MKKIKDRIFKHKRSSLKGLLILVLGGILLITKLITGTEFCIYFLPAGAYFLGKKDKQNIDEKSE